MVVNSIPVSENARCNCEHSCVAPLHHIAQSRTWHCMHVAPEMFRIPWQVLTCICRHCGTGQGVMQLSLLMMLADCVNCLINRACRLEVLVECDK